MKNLMLLIALCLSCAVSMANTYYVSPTGSDSNPGTLASPFKTIGKLSSTLRSGDIAYIRGGTYNSTAGDAGGAHFLVENLTGTAASPIKIWAYPGEVPMFDCSNITPTNGYPFAMVISNCTYVHVKGLTIKNLKQISSGNGVSRGFMFSNSNYCTAELLNVYNIGGTGVTLESSNNCTFLNCDSHNNGDGVSPDTWNFGDGFACTGGDNSTDIWFEGCRAWMNGDDNWDFFAWSGMKVTIKNCWSFWASIKPWGISGTQPSEAGMTPPTPSLWATNTAYRTSTSSGEGFKLGGFNEGGPGPAGMPTTLKKYLIGCVSFENSGTGYSENMLAQYSHQMSLVNCIAFNNGNDGFGFGVGRSVGIAHIFKNNWAWNNNQLESGADWVYDGLPNNISNNYWNTVYNGVNYGNLKPPLSITSADFQNISSVGVTAARQADGSLPTLNFLKLVSGSDLIDKGINVGLPFVSSAPDLGAFESGSGSTNIAPIANAGVDIAISLPTTSVSLTGSGSDPDGSIASYSWTQVSGPTTSSIITATSATTAVSSLGVGVYQFQLKVTDNSGATATDDVVVIVASLPAQPIPPANVAPTANAGADKTITLPTNSVNLTGSGTDTDGTIAAYLWKKISGPTGGTISTSTAATTNVTALVQGTYKFQFVVTDNLGLTGRDTVQVIVNAAATNAAPTANAGADKIITLPTNSVSLAGSGNDVGGSITSYLWSKISGPTGGTISTGTAATTNVTALIQGTYKFELKVTDNLGATGTDTVQVIVNAAPTTDTSNHAYGGIRWAIPGKVEAENFDVGGQNIAYKDTYAGNNGGAYRPTESVDMVNSTQEAGNPIVGWIDANEWMKYSVKVAATGTYTIEARVASSASANAFRIEMDGVTIATVNPTNTGGTATWKTISIPNINLTAGNKTMRIYALKTGGYNINYINFKQITTARIGETDNAEVDVNTTVNTFPLPFSTSFTVNLYGETKGVYNLTLTDLFGKVVWKKEVDKTGVSINETIYIGNLTDGVYMLQVISPDQKKTVRKLIKD